ncbi:GNAT family N-acetyltransferase [Paenibacillus rigui]|uniref:GNAT family N-acetyltransferase n=1 Tax=Paenibacillus rigui TaxID=554312 RepID=A0A229UV97_9BACL|nr:GNAT family N-acetyltransferase [Paenibacillus rigui]OXM87527.1 GNAT family N-acetyltransferase [Paenibacillus rigui]
MIHSIGPYQEEHHQQLVDIWFRAVKLTHTFLNERDIQFYHNIVQNGALKEVEVWVYFNANENPIGFIGLEGAKVEMLFVDPNYHGQGVGTSLLQYAETIKGSHLEVDVNEQNEAAHKFYKRYGFVQEGRSELDSAGRPFPLLHLTLKSKNEGL